MRSRARKLCGAKNIGDPAQPSPPSASLNKNETGLPQGRWVPGSGFGTPVQLILQQPSMESDALVADTLAASTADAVMPSVAATPTAAPVCVFVAEGPGSAPTHILSAPLLPSWEAPAMTTKVKFLPVAPAVMPLSSSTPLVAMPTSS